MLALTQMAEVQQGGLLSVLLLSVLQGLAEFLPVSSSGHLVLGRTILGLQEAGLALDIALHIGTLIAVVIAYHRECLQLLRELVQGRLRMWCWLVLGSVPAAAFGLTAKDWVEQHAANPVGVSCALFCTAAFLLLGERGRRRCAGQLPEGSSDPGYGEPRWSDALVLGCAQAVAIIPGISRSGSTISAGLVRGLSGDQAARLSFLLSIPAISGAAVLEVPDAIQSGTLGVGGGELLFAILVSGLVGAFALRFLVVALRRGAFRWFAGYCTLLGATTLIVVSVMS